MTYDDWKLETPEDEEHRKARFWRSRGYRSLDRYECKNCGFVLTQDDDAEWECIHCGAWNDPATPERDPDDARDEAMDNLLKDD